MKKKTKIFVALAVLLSSFGLFILLLPGHLYQKAISKQKSLPPTFYSPSPFKFKVKEEINTLRWKKFHFLNYQVSFPIHHPLYLVIPIAKWKNKKTQLGFKLLDGQKKEVASVRFLDSKQLNLNFKGNKFFVWPLFKENIESWNRQDLWEELFSSKTKLQFHQQIGLLVNTEKTLKEMVRKLFILHQRVNIFPSETHKIMYWKERRWGILQVESHWGQYRREIIYFFQNNQIHRIELRTLNRDSSAALFRKVFLSQLEYKKSSPHSSIALYNYYKGLNYRKKIDQEGMIYLLSAWTHSLENKKYIQEIIFFLGREKHHLMQLQPLYEYAHRRWEKALPLPVEQQKTPKKENLLKKNAKIFTETDKNFKNTKNKVKFFLEQAKKSKVNIDEQENILRKD